MVYTFDLPSLDELRALCPQVHAPEAPCGICKPKPAGEYNNDPTYLMQRLMLLKATPRGGW